MEGLASVTTSTSRVKRHQARLKRNLTYAEVELPHSLTSSLIQLGWLSEADSFNPKKVGEAFMRYIAHQKKNLLTP